MKQHAPKGLAQELDATKHAWKKIQDTFFQVLDMNHIHWNQGLCCIRTTGVNQIHLLLLCLSLSWLEMCTMKWTSDFLLYWKHLFPIPFIIQCCMKQWRGVRNMKLNWALWLKKVSDEASWGILFSKSLLSEAVHLHFLLSLTCKGTKVTKVSYHAERTAKRSSFKVNQLFICFKFTAAVQIGKFISQLISIHLSSYFLT